MRGKLLILLIGIVGSISLGYAAPAGAVDNTRDCDKYAIVYCGTMSTSEIKEKYSDGDNDKVFSAFGIKKSDIGGDIRNGIVYRDGRVVVDGKTVATGAVMAARHLGGSSISGSDTAKKVSVSKMSDAQTAFVKFDANGRFEWAIMKPCGNPVTATPPPAPKPVAECVSLKATPLSRDQYRMTAKASTKNGATVSKYVFTIKDSNGKTVSQPSVTTTALSAATDSAKGLQAGAYTASVLVTTSEGNKGGAGSNCSVRFTVSPSPAQPACTGLAITPLSDTSHQFKAAYDLRGATLKSITYVVTDTNGRELYRGGNDTYTTTTSGAYKVQAILTVTANGKDQTIQSDACKGQFSIKQKENPCPIPGKEHLPANSPDCKEEEEVPPQLPETGIIDTASKLFGITSLAGASAYYVFSRRF